VFKNTFVSIEIRMPRMTAVFNRILSHTDAGHARVVERRIVRTTNPAAARGNCSHHAILFERFQNSAHDGGSLGRPKYSRTAHTSRAGVDIEIAAKFFKARLWIFERAEVLLHIS